MADTFADHLRAEASAIIMRAAALMEHHANRTALAGPRDLNDLPTDPYQRNSVRAMRADAAALRSYAKIVCPHPPESILGEGEGDNRQCEICGAKWRVGELAVVKTAVSHGTAVTRG